MVRKYDLEFKLKALRIAQEEGCTAVEVEKRLEIDQRMISRWKRQLTEPGEAAFPGKGRLPPDEKKV